MTYDELIYQVDLLAGQSVDSDGLLISSSNRALRELYNRVKITKTARLAARGLRPVTYFREVNCFNGEQITLPAKGVAYSMRVHGSGRILVTDGESNEVTPVDSLYGTTVIKGFLSYGGSITFWGSFSFSVYDYAIYDQLFSERKEDIPEAGPTLTLDLRQLLGDFMSFISPAVDRDGIPLENCRMQDGKLEIDSEFKGEIILTYRRLPRVIGGEDGEIVDVPEEYTHLLPLLVAHHALLQSNESRARYYKSLFEEGMELIARESYGGIDCKYPLTNSWA